MDSKFCTHYSGTHPQLPKAQRVGFPDLGKRPPTRPMLTREAGDSRAARNGELLGFRVQGFTEPDCTLNRLSTETAC